MIKKYFFFLIFFFIISCSNISLVLKDTDQSNQLKNKTKLILIDGTNEKFSRELYSLIGNNSDHDYILKVVFIENKENMVVKQNQVAEKIDYTLEVNYDLFYKKIECKIFSKKIISNFSLTPKSAGYNFSTDRTFEKLYLRSVRKNIQNFINLGPFKDSCV